MLINLGYVSTQARQLTAQEQVSLLKDAQEKNARLDVTGMLIHRDDSFFQILEGEQETVHQLFATISEDSRHTRVEKLFEEQITQREFAQWSMDMRKLDDELLKQIPDFANAQPEELQIVTLFRELPKVKQLLQAFQTMPS